MSPAAEQLIDLIAAEIAAELACAPIGEPVEQGGKALPPPQTEKAAWRSNRAHRAHRTDQLPERAT